VTIRDPFDILGELDSFGHVVFSDAAWAHIRQVIKDKIGRDADAIRIMLVEGHDETVPLRYRIEAAIGSYLFKQEFQARYPLQTAKQILPALLHTEHVLREAKRVLKTPEVALYAFDWGRDRGGPKSMIALIEGKLQELSERIEWLSRVFPNEPFPGLAAPRDVAPTEGWQKHHHDLAGDPEGDLVEGLLEIYKHAFEREPTTTRDGPVSAFLCAILQPVFGDLTKARVRYWVRRAMQS
jgi:hypothetical protein